MDAPHNDIHNEDRVRVLCEGQIMMEMTLAFQWGHHGNNYYARSVWIVDGFGRTLPKSGLTNLCDKLFRHRQDTRLQQRKENRVNNRDKIRRRERINERNDKYVNKQNRFLDWQRMWKHYIPAAAANLNHLQQLRKPQLLQTLFKGHLSNRSLEEMLLLTFTTIV